MTADPHLLAPAIILVALAIKTALVELRHPGTAREEWTFVTDGKALTAGAAAAAATVLLGWNHIGITGAPAWACLVGALTAQLFHRSTRRP
ncbi:hypothetical protein ACFYM3_04455 [Streptomyces massasporeus]|uniref:Uncharacterized protein n=1 Tax=Streptomyces massasporeus TaxID=67324 RepID=A0ABW6L8L2_9ACTN